MRLHPSPRVAGELVLGSEYRAGRRRGHRGVRSVRQPGAPVTGLTIFELLTAVFASDARHYEKTGEDFRLNDDWKETKRLWEDKPVLACVENTDFLQAITMLATYERQQADESGRKLAVREKNDTDDERRESIVNKTMLSARTNRIIGGGGPVHVPTQG